MSGWRGVSPVGVPSLMKIKLEGEMARVSITHDEWVERCVPSGGAIFNEDKIGRRNGQGEYYTR